MINFFGESHKKRIERNIQSTIGKLSGLMNLIKRELKASEYDFIVIKCFIESHKKRIER